MPKEISISYSINVFFEKKFQVEDDFALVNGGNLNDAFKEIVEKFPEEKLQNFDDTICDCDSKYFGQNPFELDSIEITNLENPVSEVQFISE